MGGGNAEPCMVFVVSEWVRQCRSLYGVYGGVEESKTFPVYEWE